MPDPTLREALVTLLEALESIGGVHVELYDTDVREQMFEAIHRSFLKPGAGYDMPATFGMFDAGANLAIRKALMEYVQSARRRADEMGLDDPKGRLDAFQDPDAVTRGGQSPDSFFGWASSI